MLTDILLSLITGIIASFLSSIIVINTVDREIRTKKIIKRCWKKASKIIEYRFPGDNIKTSFREFKKKVDYWESCKQDLIKFSESGDLPEADCLGINIISGDEIKILSAFWGVFIDNLKYSIFSTKKTQSWETTITRMHQNEGKYGQGS